MEQKGETMYLDETIMQSRTTLTLVDFIDELYELLEEENVIVHNPLKWNEVKNKYHEIKGQATKAEAKRGTGMKFRKE